jgi:membrane protease YdiL (CAAX protease family)
MLRGSFGHKSPANQIVLTASIAAVSFFLIGVIGAFALSAITGFKAEDLLNPTVLAQRKADAVFFIRGMQLFQFIGLFLVPSLLAAYLFSSNTKNYLGIQKPFVPYYWFLGILTILISMPFVQWIGELNREIPLPTSIAKWIAEKEDSADLTVKAMLANQTIKELLLNLFFIAGLAAVGEELLFRGILQRLFIKHFRSPWAGIVIAAFLFSALHMQFLGFFPRFMLGVIMGAAYWYSGSLWIAILTHFLYDGLLVTLTYFNPGMLNESSPVVSASALMVSGLISAFFVTMNIHWMMRNTNASVDDYLIADSVAADQSAQDESTN